MNPTAHRWFERLATLKCDKSRGSAPHKPLLLLVVLDLVAEGKLSDGHMLRDGNLAFRFSSYWSIIAGRRSSKPDVRLPFYHMKSDGFWTPLDGSGKAAAARELTVSARLDPEFLLCAQDEAFRLMARRTLIATYFEPHERAILYGLTGVQPLLDDATAAEVRLFGKEDVSELKRDLQFSLRVLPAYDFTCALTRYRMVSIDGTTAVDAAHIKQFKKGGPNCPENGIALSKTAHWLFDRGFWSIGDDYRVLVKIGHFDEAGEAAHLLKPRTDMPILLPSCQDCQPNREYLAWHRERHGFT